MDENEKKRKAGVTPPESTKKKLIRKSKRIAKKVDKPYILEHSSSDEDRNRTPSGTYINTKVSDIRNYFDQSAESLKSQAMSDSSQLSVNATLKSSNTHQCTSDSQVEMKSKPSATLNKGRHTSVSTDENKIDHVDSDFSASKGTDQEGWADNSSLESDTNNTLLNTVKKLKKSDDDKETEFLHTLAAMLPTKEASFEEEEDNLNHSKESNTAISKSEQGEIEMEFEQQIGDQEASPQSINIHSVMEMFRELKRDREADKQELKQTLKEITTSCINAAKRQAKSSVRQETTKIHQVEAEMAYYKLKSETLMEVCQRLNDEVSDLTSRVENLEFNSTKKKLLLSGLKIDSNLKKWQNILDINSFLSQYLEIEVIIDDYFSLGELEQRQTVLIFQSIEERRQVYRFKSLLKGVTHQGKEVFINEYLPPTALDRKRRERDIFNMYENQPDVVTYGRGGLCVNGQLYKKKIHPPTPKELINMTALELDTVLKIETKRSPKILMDKSAFVGYCASVDSYEDIQKVYKKIRMVQPDAKHIVCAYQMKEESNPDSPSHEPCYQMDYYDDGEPSAGRLLLDLLVEENIQQKVVFVARIYGGQRIGTDRFKCYLRAAKMALEINVPEPDQIDPKPAPAFPRQGNTRAEGNRGRDVNPRGRRGYRRGGDRAQMAGRRRMNYNNNQWRNQREQSVRGARPPSTQNRQRQYPEGYENYGTNPDFRTRVGNSRFTFSEPWKINDNFNY